MTVTRLLAEMPHEEYTGWLAHDSLTREEDAKAKKAAARKRRHGKR